MSYFRALFAVAYAVCGCGSDWVRVVVEGSSPDLTAIPALVEVSVYGGGLGTSYSYTDTLERREGSLPFTDSVVVFDDETSETVTVRTRVTTPLAFGADATLALPAEGSDLLLQLAAGERSIARSARFSSGDVGVVASFKGGLVFAWPAQDGVKVAELREPDASLSAVTRERSVSSETGASSVRIASRPDSASFGSDLYAVVWRETGGSAKLAAGTPGGLTSAVDLGPADSVHVACARKGVGFDVATAKISGGSADAMVFGVSGSTIASARPSHRLKDGAASLVGVTVALDAVIVAGRTDSGSWLARWDLGGEPTVIDTPGSARSISRSIDGNRVFLATELGGSLVVESYFANSLAKAGESEPIARLPFVPEQPRARVSISECLISWPEVRADGSELVDVRAQLFDTNGQPSGVSTLMNVDSAGHHFAPTSVCASPARGYVAFFAEASDSLSGSLWLRRVPSQSLFFAP
ncbi:MAG: hypothetical protein HY791_33210 [Deltaproteobacteria bacterium]|nr:hypothetical protein [Deltaproteobacteria bacterium]